LAEDLSAQVLQPRQCQPGALSTAVSGGQRVRLPSLCVLAARLEQARKLLTMTTLLISRIAGDCGFSSQSHLTASFRTAHAATPAEYREHVKRTTAKRDVRPE
jgi:AraC family transcriptional regulator